MQALAACCRRTHQREFCARTSWEEGATNVALESTTAEFLLLERLQIHLLRREVRAVVRRLSGRLGAFSRFPRRAARSMIGA